MLLYSKICYLPSLFHDQQSALVAHMNSLAVIYRPGGSFHVFIEYALNICAMNIWSICCIVNTVVTMNVWRRHYIDLQYVQIFFPVIRNMLKGSCNSHESFPRLPKVCSLPA